MMQAWKNVKPSLEMILFQNPVSGYLPLTEGDNASLSCELLDEKENENNEDMLRSLRSSRSISIFTWTREGLQFTNTGKYTHLGTELNINNVTKADAGFYFCTTKARTGKRYFIYIWRCRNHIYPD